MKTNSLPAIALGAILSFTWVPAMAQQKADPTKRMATRDELRSCLGTESELQSRRGVLNERAKKVDEAARQIQAESEEVKGDRERLDGDPTITGPRRDRMERKLRQHNAKVNEYKELEAKFEADKVAFESDHTAWRDKCTTVQFRQDDMDAVMKEREAAGKK